MLFVVQVKFVASYFDKDSISPDRVLWIKK